MSARDHLNKQQIPDFSAEQPFGQLRMFVPTNEIIDTYPKADAGTLWDGVHTPRQQWELPNPHPENKGMSLRDAKRAQVMGQYGKMERVDENYEARQRGEPEKPIYQSRGQMIDKGDAPPLTLAHWAAGDTPFLANGHHRLALLEERGHTEIPVEYEIEEGFGRGGRLGRKVSR